MKVARVVVLLGLVAFACAQINAGQAWQGTWSNGKRAELGGSLFICVDLSTATAHGAYGSGGLMSGSIQGNTWKGFWYEAGYDRPYGPFEVTISGGSFSGTWGYAGTNFTASFSSSQSSNVAPSHTECLAPITAGNVDGTYTDAAICYHPDIDYSNTNQQFASGFFSTFGIVQGFSFDNGVSLSLSDFTFPDDEDTTNSLRYKPENQPDFGPGCTSEECLDDDSDDDVVGDDDDSVDTRRIAVGRLVDQNTFCGGFWEGFYNRFVGNVCFTRQNVNQPDTFLCGSDVVYINGHADIFEAFDGQTSEILDIVQEAFDNLVLPPIVIEDDDGNTDSIPTDSIDTNSITTADESPASPGDESPASPGAESPSGSDAGRLAASAVIVVVALALF